MSGREEGRRDRAEGPPLEPARPAAAATAAVAQRGALTSAAAGGYALTGGAAGPRPPARPVAGEVPAGAGGEALTAHAAAVDPALSAPQTGAGRLDPPQPVVLTGPPHAQLRAAAQAIAAAGDGDRVELRLDPPELGRVMIHMRIEDGALSAQITADRPETLDLMRRNADILQRELQAAGFGRADLDFSGQRRQQAEAPISMARDARDAEQSASAAPVAARRSPGDRLDIRL
ncbi:flagellar hook-length control protein FliK [Rubrimonas cliftonensis]|uniref:Hook-length control protein FliK n=1 Tax=Rubrimonas cliftonensis TaxID=89524 RepID=A0A1H4C7E7_9RHOB|nr:flagellar hook-length control protein FliK [Rubrimonas cliftonensis]SEA56233.1 hook-length control protein FliK [Rubrimonas cliftonensis]